MPMVVYTEDEVIEKCNEAEALGASRAATDRDRSMAENTAMRKKLNDLRDALEQIVANRDNKNWRKPEMVACAEHALKTYK